MQIIHTSGREQGQIYVPFTNWTLYLAVVALVVGFQNSSNLAAAYGIAVTGTMLIDTILIGFVMVLLWQWHLARGGRGGALRCVDLAFFSRQHHQGPGGRLVPDRHRRWCRSPCSPPGVAGASWCRGNGRRTRCRWTCSSSIGRRRASRFRARRCS
jgi:hypothetical protein